MGIKQAFADAKKKQQQAEEATDDDESEFKTPKGFPPVWIKWVDEDYDDSEEHPCSRVHFVATIYTPYYGRTIRLDADYDTAKPLAEYKTLADVLIKDANPYEAVGVGMDHFSRQEIAFNNATAWALAGQLLVILNRGKKEISWVRNDVPIPLNEVIRERQVEEAHQFVEGWNRGEIALDLAVWKLRGFILKG